ncbi:MULTISPECIES: hypothetical protein [Hoeflea]|uniref:hypothetical protein n=1 Tax=Hoeflea TaxID=274591 RepID=UPI0022AFE526|nr:hypothetical protein [Hoeflea alexandrii]MCZ4292350.1 hypothetical protein [Hoeflea alexandrii]
MKKSVRHLAGRRHLFLVLMLVIASIMPGALHAAAMAGSAAVNSGVHHVSERSSADHAMMSHHQAEDGHSDAVQDPLQADHGNMQDQCCPISCSFALCSFEPERVAVFIPDSFEIEPMLGFVVTAIALPERPPRI